jgi:hypothetical protein|tara:strand:- start:667 stop:906 length:240 start_codon:yes stop_codon:yes gene_type:complete
MTSNIIHHLRELQDAWRRQEFVFTNKQTEEYDILVAARRQVVRGFYETGRVFKGSKAAFDKENAEAEAANPVEVEDEDY